jgi:hypothetical protein
MPGYGAVPSWSRKDCRAVPPDSVTGEKAWYDPKTGLFDTEKKIFDAHEKAFNDVRSVARHQNPYHVELLRIFDERRGVYIEKHLEQTASSILFDSVSRKVKNKQDEIESLNSAEPVVYYASAIALVIKAREENPEDPRAFVDEQCEKMRKDCRDHPTHCPGHPVQLYVRRRITQFGGVGLWHRGHLGTRVIQEAHRVCQ